MTRPTEIRVIVEVGPDLGPGVLMTKVEEVINSLDGVKVLKTGVGGLGDEEFIDRMRSLW